MWGTMPDVIDRASGYYADKIAIIDGERRLTYREMRDFSDRLGSALVSLGLHKGERVGLLLPNSLEFLPSQHGIWKAGGVLVQMPTRASAQTQRTNLEQAAATTLIYHAKFQDIVEEMRVGLPKLTRFIRVGGDAAFGTDHPLAEVLAAAPSRRPEVYLTVRDEAHVLFTSGSTGEPKGVVQSHYTWAHYAVSAGLEIGDIRFGEVFAHGAPLTHFTQIFAMPTFVRGGTNVMLPGLEVEGLLNAIEKYKVTATAVVPTIIYLLVDHPERADHDLSSLNTMIYAGSPIAPEKLRAAFDAFGPIFIQTYAGTEQGYVSCLRKNEHGIDTAGDIARLASAGRPMFQVEIAIRDDAGNDLAVGEVGEICSRQEGQMLHYLDKALTAETVRNGWVHTGDVGRLDEDGFLYLVDRKKDMVVSGGFNVFPRQVEDVLCTHPRVAQAAVIGVPHAKWGEAVHAFVVLKDAPAGDHSEIQAVLTAEVKTALGSIPAPKTMDFLAELPVNPAGKVDKRSLRAPFWQGRDRQIG